MDLDASQDMSLKDELFSVLEQVEKNEEKSSNTFETLKDELSWYEKNPKTIPPTLKKLYKAIGSIPPSSVESERIFSITGSFVTKVRSSLGDESIDALVFLKKYYKVK